MKFVAEIKIIVFFTFSPPFYDPDSGFYYGKNII